VRGKVLLQEVAELREQIDAVALGSDAVLRVLVLDELTSLFVPRSVFAKSSDWLNGTFISSRACTSSTGTLISAARALGEPCSRTSGSLSPRNCAAALPPMNCACLAPKLAGFVTPAMLTTKR
jgi:hypothetical protein